jgi:methionyl-tRNA formyltransferase
VVVAFGHLLREPLLSAPLHGCVNVHASLLPRWRGAAPIHRALLAGDRTTGVTTMRLTAGLDEGPIYLSAATAIGPDETASQLHDRLAPLGAQLLLRTIEGLEAGALPGTPQAAAGATWAPPLRKDEGTVDFGWPASRVHDTVRALEAWPKVTVRHGERRLAVAGSHLPPAGERSAAPGAPIATAGRVCAIGSAGMEVQCGEGSVRLARVLPEGGRWMDPASYARGHGLAAGDVLRPLNAQARP